MTTKDEAKCYLNDAASDKCFWVNNGPIIKSLDELANALSQISDEIFQHHVTQDKNDFSTWIDDVIGDKKLANDLLSSKSRESALKKIRSRLNSLKKKAG